MLFMLARSLLRWRCYLHRLISIGCCHLTFVSAIFIKFFHTFLRIHSVFLRFQSLSSAFPFFEMIIILTCMHINLLIRRLSLNLKCYLLLEKVLLTQYFFSLKLKFTHTYTQATIDSSCIWKWNDTKAH